MITTNTAKTIETTNTTAWEWSSQSVEIAKENFGINENLDASILVEHNKTTIINFKNEEWQFLILNTEENNTVSLFEKVIIRHNQDLFLIPRNAMWWNNLNLGNSLNHQIENFIDDNIFLGNLEDIVVLINGIERICKDANKTIITIKPGKETKAKIDAVIEYGQIHLEINITVPSYVYVSLGEGAENLLIDIMNPSITGDHIIFAEKMLLNNGVFFSSIHKFILDTISMNDIHRSINKNPLGFGILFHSSDEVKSGEYLIETVSGAIATIAFNNKDIIQKI